MPVTTRHAKRPAVRTDYDFDSEDEDSSNSLSDDDDDWKPKGSPVRSSGRPQAKRARRGTRNVDQTKDTNAKLSVFPILPLDIVFEILSLLTPVDLANLAHTDRAFRATLTSPQAANVWSAARKHAGKVPDCPPNAGEVSWARFIYGAPKCQECGVHNIYHVDYSIMRRVCRKCKRKNLVYSKFFPRRFPDLDPEMLELIPHTTTGSSRSRRSKQSSKYYWEDDIHAIAAIYGQYRQDIDLRKPWATEALKRFKDERIKHVQAVMMHASVCQARSRDFLIYRDNELRDRAAQIYDELKRRLQDMGYEDEDIEAIRRMDAASKDRPITNHVWSRIKHALTTQVDIARCRRLEQDEAPTITARKRLVKNAYNDYKRTLQPIEWICLPPARLIYAMPQFRSLIYTNLDIPLNQATCDKAAAQLPEHISAFSNKLKRHLSEEIANTMPSGTSGKKAKRLDEKSVDDSRLFQAASVFRVAGHNKLCTFDDIVAYLAWRGTQQTHGTGSYIQMLDALGRDRYVPAFSFDRFGSAMVEAVIAALGLPSTARAEDLDRLDRRFVCKLCDSTSRAYSWRDIITHNWRTHMWRTARVQALSEEASAVMREAEGPDPAEAQTMWSCNHCVVHLNNLQTRPAAVMHVQEIHAIVNPEENIDIFHAFPTARRHPDPCDPSILLGQNEV